MFEDPVLDRTYKELLGIQGHKPFDCVGEVKECRQAVVMARAKGDYPELDKFQFPPFKFDYRKLHAYSMPPEYFDIISRLA